MEALCSRSIPGPQQLWNGSRTERGLMAEAAGPGGHQKEEEEGRLMSSQRPGQERSPGGRRWWRDGTIEWKQLFILSIIVIVLLLGLIIALATETCPKCGETCPICGETCPDDWVQFRKKCYLFNGEKNWTESQEFCKSQGAELVVIESQQELSLVQKFQNSWIGLYRNNEEFYWVNGAPLNKSLFEVTDPGDCAYVSASKIATNSCSTCKFYICSKNMTVT
ncbi:C-type lectin domain family 2 member L-like [Tachyglossus aculeatus]|uniref:C-type lectin domain family 2 member L-like n=1 Tax=Tachyglossus aculeatus TaxID=9261 RepID=UPI0018F41B50|nr:C-type lectin domain family 2 member L-like [Tachyglossus aculeatus]